MTPITVTDPALIEQLRRADATELRDPGGRVLGEFTARDSVPPRPHAELFRLLETGQEMRLPPGSTRRSPRRTVARTASNSTAGHWRTSSATSKDSREVPNRPARRRGPTHTSA